MCAELSANGRAVMYRRNTSNGTHQKVFRFWLNAQCLCGCMRRNTCVPFWGQAEHETEHRQSINRSMSRNTGACGAKTLDTWGILQTYRRNTKRNSGGTKMQAVPEPGGGSVPLCRDTRINTKDKGGTLVPLRKGQTEHEFRLGGTPPEHRAEHGKTH